MNEKILKDLAELEAIADLLMEKASALKKHCHLARTEMAGVSISDPEKRAKAERLAWAGARAVAKRNARIKYVKNPSVVENPMIENAKIKKKG